MAAAAAAIAEAPDTSVVAGNLYAVSLLRCVYCDFDICNYLCI